MLGKLAKIFETIRDVCRKNYIFLQRYFNLFFIQIRSKYNKAAEQIFPKTIRGVCRKKIMRWLTQLDEAYNLNLSFLAFTN